MAILQWCAVRLMLLPTLGCGQALQGPEPQFLAIEPAAVQPFVTTPARLLGANFYESVTVQIDERGDVRFGGTWTVHFAQAPAAVATARRVDSTALTVELPALEPGVYDILLEDPWGGVEELRNGLTVRGAPGLDLNAAAADLGAAAADLGAPADVVPMADGAAVRDLEVRPSPPDLGGCQAELCNGLDDDCDGTVDNGCPIAISMTARTEQSGLFGNPNGGVIAYDESCPLGQVLIGLKGMAKVYIDQGGGLCATMTLVENRNSIPYTYTVATGAGATLPIYGKNTTNPYTFSCPPNTVAIAAQGQAGMTNIDAASSIHFVCAPIVINGAPGKFIITFGIEASVGVDGSMAYPAFSFRSTIGMLDRFFGRSGNVLDDVAFGARGPTLLLR